MFNSRIIQIWSKFKIMIFLDSEKMNRRAMLKSIRCRQLHHLFINQYYNEAGDSEIDFKDIILNYQINEQ